MTLLLSHRGGEELGFGDNTIFGILESLNRGFDIIELDVRKSKDNILYCYHGSIIESLFKRLFMKNKTIKRLKERKGIITLYEAIELIGNKAYIFLDIKETDIIPEEFIKCFKSLHLKGIYISGMFGLKKLLTYIKIKDVIQNTSLVYVNLNPFRSNIDKAIKNKIDIVQLYYWQINTTLDKKLKVLINPFFVTKSIYREKIKKFDIYCIRADKL